MQRADPYRTFDRDSTTGDPFLAQTGFGCREMSGMMTAAHLDVLHALAEDAVDHSETVSKRCGETVPNAACRRVAYS